LSHKRKISIKHVAKPVCKTGGIFMKKIDFKLIYTPDDNHVPIGSPTIKEGVYGLEIRKSGIIGFVSIQELVEMIIHNADKR
jgi:hypothetical protein